MEEKIPFTRLKSLFPVFSQYELLQEIVGKSDQISLPAGHRIMDVGHLIKIVPLVISGSIKVMREDQEGHEILLYYIKAGESCAMTLNSSLRREKSAIKAIVESPVTLLAVPVEVVYGFVRRFPSWDNFIRETYAQRFEEMIEVVDHIAFHKLDVRLLKYLMDKTQLLQTKKLNVSRTAVAKDLNSSREVISRLLKQMEKNKLIRLDGGEIELL